MKSESDRLLTAGIWPCFKVPSQTKWRALQCWTGCCPLSRQCGSLLQIFGRLHHTAACRAAGHAAGAACLPAGRPPPLPCHAMPCQLVYTVPAHPPGGTAGLGGVEGSPLLGPGCNGGRAGRPRAICSGAILSHLSHPLLPPTRTQLGGAHAEPRVAPHRLLVLQAPPHRLLVRSSLGVSHSSSSVR